MRIARPLAALAAATLLITGGAVVGSPAANAESAPLAATGITRVTTAPGLVKALLHNRIVPYGLGSTSTSLSYNRWTGLRATFGFPITGVTLDDAAAGAADPANVNVLHSGGLAFANVHKGKRVTTRNYTIDIGAGVITADVTANGASVGRIPVFAIDLSGAKISYTVPTDGRADVRKVAVSLAPGVAAVLNASLKTKVFTEGAAIGTARVKVRSVG